MTQQVPETPDKPLLLLATALGLAAIIALPLTASTTPQFAAALVFATPLLLIVLGRLNAQRWQSVLGISLSVLLVVIVIAGIANVALPGGQFLAVAVLFAGPVVAAVGVGVPLRNRDVAASAAFLLSATIAVVFGFIGASAPFAGLLVIGVVVAGWLVVHWRLDR